MKKCDHFKDLILTDYIDGELDKAAVHNIESHLLDCSDCRAFLKEVKNNVALPLNQALRQPVPGELWDTIRQNIEHDNQAANPLSDIIEKLKGLFVFPKLVPIFASLMVMLLVGSATINTMHLNQLKAQDQGEYLVSLLGPAGGSTSSEGNDLGTPIEHYFL